MTQVAGQLRDVVVAVTVVRGRRSVALCSAQLGIDGVRFFRAVHLVIPVHHGGAARGDLDAGIVEPIGLEPRNQLGAVIEDDREVPVVPSVFNQVSQDVDLTSHKCVDFNLNGRRLQLLRNGGRGGGHRGGRRGGAGVGGCRSGRCCDSEERCSDDDHSFSEHGVYFLLVSRWWYYACSVCLASFLNSKVEPLPRFDKMRV